MDREREIAVTKYFTFAAGQAFTLESGRALSPVTLANET